MASINAARAVAEAPVVRIGQALAHPLRVRVLTLLLGGEAFRAGMLARRFHVALPLMKQHLVKLQAAGLVRSVRIDGAVFYRLGDPTGIDSVRPLLALGVAGAAG